MNLRINNFYKTIRKRKKIITTNKKKSEIIMDNISGHLWLSIFELWFEII